MPQLPQVATFLFEPFPMGRVLGINLSGSLVGIAPMNAGDLVGAVTVTWTGAGTYPGQVSLGGADASKFALTNSGFLPCNLVVGASNIPAGNYNVTLSAN